MTLLKETGHENREQALLDLSRTLFFAGYRVWKKRQQLATRYLEEIGQRQQNGIALKRRKRKKENAENAISQSNCQNPFHYFRRYDNLSKQRPTKCPCRNIVDITKVYANHPITEFVHKYLNENAPDFSAPLRNTTNSPSHQNFFITRTDKIRREHDRGKKRTYKQLPLKVTITKKQRIMNYPMLYLTVLYQNAFNLSHYTVYDT